jgi:hypothetical protein
VPASLPDSADLARIGANHSVLDLVANAVLAQRVRVCGVHCSAVVGLDTLEKRLIGGAELIRLQAEDTVHLVRLGQAIVDEVQLPAAK